MNSCLSTDPVRSGNWPCLDVWVTVSGMFAYLPLIKHWPEDLVPINIQLDPAARHFPGGEKRHRRPKQHVSITVCHCRRTSASCRSLVCGKSERFSPHRCTFLGRKDLNIPPVILQQTRGDSIATCTLNDEFVSRSWRRGSFDFFTCTHKSPVNLFLWSSPGDVLSNNMRRVWLHGEVLLKHRRGGGANGVGPGNHRQPDPGHRRTGGVHERLHGCSSEEFHTR